MKTKSNYLNSSGKILILLTIFLMIVTACKKEDHQITDQEYRLSAWNYLNKAQQETVIGKWEEAPVNRQTTYQNGDAVSVTFSTKYDGLVGPIQIYFDPKSNKILGRPIGF